MSSRNKFMWQEYLWQSLKNKKKQSYTFCRNFIGFFLLLFCFLHFHRVISKTKHPNFWYNLWQDINQGGAMKSANRHHLGNLTWCRPMGAHWVTSCNVGQHLMTSCTATIGKYLSLTQSQSLRPAPMGLAIIKITHMMINK